MRTKNKFFSWKQNRYFKELWKTKINTNIMSNMFNLSLPQSFSKFIKFRAKRKKFVLKLRKSQIEKQKLLNMTLTTRRKLIKRIRKKILKNRKRNNKRRRRKINKKFFFKKRGVSKKKGYLTQIYKYKRKKKWNFLKCTKRYVSFNHKIKKYKNYGINRYYLYRKNKANRLFMYRKNASKLVPLILFRVTSLLIFLLKKSVFRYLNNFDSEDYLITLELVIFKIISTLHIPTTSLCINNNKSKEAACKLYKYNSRLYYLNNNYII